MGNMLKVHSLMEMVIPNSDTLSDHRSNVISPAINHTLDARVKQWADALMRHCSLPRRHSSVYCKTKESSTVPGTLVRLVIVSVLVNHMHVFLHTIKSVVWRTCSYRHFCVMSTLSNY